jgi:hypothetical protein
MLTVSFSPEGIDRLPPFKPANHQVYGAACFASLFINLMNHCEGEHIMTDTNNTGNGKNKPPYLAYSVRDRGRGRDSIWTKIGAAWPHDDGQGFTVHLDALPLGEQITLRVPKEKDDQSADA